MASAEEGIIHLRNMFELLEEFLQMDEFDTDLKEELSAACPNYFTVLSTAKRDLLISDCGIVITGECSAGKTSLVNLLIQYRKLFKSKNAANTGTICRIRNSETMRVKLFTKNDTLKNEFHINDLKQLRSTLKKCTSIKELQEENDVFCYVDVYLPVKILKENVIIVDTPGIGETENLDNMLLDFLPHAVSFIFVINANNAGGIHEDRIMKILKSIIDNKQKMPCFDPRDVMFLTNTWDIVEKDSSDDEDEEDDENDPEKRETLDEETWTLIKDKLYKGWGPIPDNNMFRVSLKQVKQGETSELTKEYDRFKTVLLETIERNANKRMLYYYSFFKTFANNAERGTRARLQLLETSQQEQEMQFVKNSAEIAALSKECIESKANFKKCRDETISKLNERLYTFLHSPDGQDEILNPARSASISSVSRRLLKEEVCRRIELGIRKWCEGEEVNEIMKEFEANIHRNLQEIENRILAIDEILTGISLPVIHAAASASIVAGIARFAVFGYTYFRLPFAFSFSVVFVVTFAHFLLFWGWDFVWSFTVAGHQKMVAEIYQKCLKSLKLQECIEQSFDKTFGNIEKIFDETIPQKLKSLQELNERLLKDREQIKQKRESFMRLKDKMETLQNKTSVFEKIINSACGEAK